MTGVGQTVAFHAGMMARDEEVRVDELGEGFSGLDAGVPAPGKGVDGATSLEGLGGPMAGFEDGEVKVGNLIAVGHGVAEVNTVRGATGQGPGAEQVGIGAQDEFGVLAVGFFDTLSEEGVESEAFLADGAAGELGKLVVAQNDVKAVRILALECADEVDEAVRAVNLTFVRVDAAVVDEFLQDQMPAGVLVSAASLIAWAQTWTWPWRSPTTRTSSAESR